MTSVPNSEDDKLLFQELMLCPNGARDWVNDEGARRLEVLQERLKWPAAAAAKATTTSIRNKMKSIIPDVNMEMAAAAQCRDPERRNILQKNVRKACRKFHASREVLRSKIVRKKQEHTATNATTTKSRRQRCRQRGSAVKCASRQGLAGTGDNDEKTRLTAQPIAW